jgi:hypothetical protein
MTNIIAEQLSFRPPLPEIFGCKDYREERELLVRIDEILEMTGADERFRQLSLQQYDQWLEKQQKGKECSHDGEEKASDEAADQWSPPAVPYTTTGKLKASWIHHTRCALRVNILRDLTGDSLREMSIRLADSALARWFCHVNEFGPVQAQSKSTVDRYESWIDSDAIGTLITEIIHQAATLDNEPVLHPLGLEQPIDLSQAWLDGTCLKADIHFPIDWVLLRDASRTLLKATCLIRKRGLKNRMPQDPEAFLRDMNKLVMEMTQSQRKKGGKKLRKAILRKMTKLGKKIARHGRKHRDILEKRWAETDLSQAQAQQIIERIDGVLAQLPAAIEQARERLIGERQVANKDKILSLYEPEVGVIVRGKAGAEVEFGNLLRLAEQRDGLIVDFKLYRSVVSDQAAEPFVEGIERLLEQTGGRLEKLWTDRGMESAKNVSVLEEAGIVNGICPKRLDKLKEKMSDPEYAAGQKRRASTEARIGIFKNNILGGRLRVKGYANRQRAVAWGVLTHNLWVLARLPQAELQETQKQEARARGEPLTPAA